MYPWWVLVRGRQTLLTPANSKHPGKGSAFREQGTDQLLEPELASACHLLNISSPHLGCSLSFHVPVFKPSTLSHASAPCTFPLIPFFHYLSHQSFLAFLLFPSGRHILLSDPCKWRSPIQYRNIPWYYCQYCYLWCIKKWLGPVLYLVAKVVVGQGLVFSNLNGSVAPWFYSSTSDNSWFNHKH